MVSISSRWYIQHLTRVTQSYGNGYGGYGGGGYGGYGGGGGGGGGGGWGDSGDKMSGLGGNLRAIDWSSQKMAPGE